MLFYQFINSGYWELALNTRGDEWDKAFDRAMLSAFHPELFYPEVLIPEAIILLLLGSMQLIIMKWHVKNENVNNKFDQIMMLLTVSIIFFIIIFIPLFIIVHDFYGRYSVFDPLFGIIVALIDICLSIRLLLYLKKIEEHREKNTTKNIKPTRRLLHPNVLNYRLITAFFVVLILILLIVIIPYGRITPRTYQSVYWEDSNSLSKTALPGMNVSFNLILESKGGRSISKYVIVGFDEVGLEEEVKGNWSISPKCVTVRPDERKTITFTNYIQENSTEDDNYYRFVFIELNERGYVVAMNKECFTEITNDTNEYNASQSNSISSPWQHVSSGVGRSSLNVKLAELAIITFLTWILTLKN
jgi:hypothetical protein